MSRATVLPGRFLIGVAMALVSVLSVPPWCSAEGQSAVVEGTTQLFIRRGPGTEFPPFATLTGGSQVELQERHGAWARVTTASGQVGYVHSKYLRVLEEATPEAPPTQPLPPSAKPTQPAPTATRRRRGAEPTEAPAEPTAAAIRADTSTPTPTLTPASFAARSRGGTVQREIERLSEAVEALNRRLDQRFPIPDAGGSPTSEAGTGVSGGAILLGLVGVIVGWFLGATYQRNKERGRRSRIRL